MDHDSAHGREDRYVVGWRGIIFYFLYLLLGEPPETQPLPGGLDRSGGGLLHNPALTLTQLINGPDRLKEFLFGGQDLGTIHIYHVLAFLYPDPGIIHEEAVNPSRYPCGNITHPGLVEINLPNHPDLGVDEFPLHRAHPYLRQFPGRLGDGKPARPLHFIAAGYCRDQIHSADGTLAWLCQPDLRMHGTGPDSLLIHLSGCPSFSCPRGRRFLSAPKKIAQDKSGDYQQDKQYYRDPVSGSDF